MNSDADYDELICRAARARFVLIGEASHGTKEFYQIRARLTQRLIVDRGFRVIAAEADWPDMLRVNRYVNGWSEDEDAKTALADFRRFPAWMWRNTVMVDFVEWLREWNLDRPNPAGIFGMDLYSLHTSIEAVIEYLHGVDEDAARRARERYECFELFGSDPQTYGYVTTTQRVDDCEEEVMEQLAELRRRYSELIARDGQRAKDEFFYAEQNARLVANAECYYRAMFRGRDASWNLRDEHMADTIAALGTHFTERGGKTIVWAHNSHLGDAGATEMSERGEWNVGELLRQRYPDEVFSIGFTTHSGTVTAARDWGDVAERRRVRPALEGSYESVFHQTGLGHFWVNLQGRSDASIALADRRLERAIGVIYRPETERGSHYFEACLPEQFDAVIHMDETSALEPLERNSEWIRGEMPETFPVGV